jgi:two-component system sensor histidine kinase AlgZ
LGDRLRVRWERVEPLPWDLKLPRLVLQPLVENAVIHGVAQLAEGGEIAIVLRVHDRELQVTVSNPYPAGTDVAAGNGHAQQSVLQRLRYRFGKAAGMATRQDSGCYACELTLPIA